MINYEISDKADLDWNKRVMESRFGTVFQTSDYGTYEKIVTKSEPIYVRFFNENEQLVAQILLFNSLRGRGKITSLFGRGSLYSTLSKISLLPRFTNWVFGPIIFDETYYREISESLANLLESWKTKFEGKIHPLDEKFTFSENYNFHKNEASTFIIDLNQDLNDIFKNSDKKSVQKNIERSQERGVSISEITTSNDIQIYHELLNQYRASSNLSTYAVEDTTAVFSLVQSTGYAGFLAWYEKIPIGGIFISTFNGYINEWGIARSGLDTEKKLYSQDLLRWKIIEWGKKHGCRFYDLSGVKLTDQSPKEKGIFQNKKKWGGKLVRYPIFTNR